MAAAHAATLQTRPTSAHAGDVLLYLLYMFVLLAALLVAGYFVLSVVRARYGLSRREHPKRRTTPVMDAWKEAGRRMQVEQRPKEDQE